MPRPDFFFVGHPRSGSGSLDSYLAGHPDIFMARKELHYFGSDLGYFDPPRSLPNYLDHFAKAGGARRVGEASTWYLVSELAASEIKDFAPDAHIVMQLREPVSWLHSLHSHLVFSGDEDILEFEEALAAEPDRLQGRRLPRWSIPACALYYRKNTCYADQVRRYYDAFGRDRVHILLLDELTRDAEGEFKRLLGFLGLRAEFEGLQGLLQASERSRNSNRTVYSRRLRTALNRPALRRVLVGADPAPVPGAGMAIRALRRANIRYTSRSPMDPALRARLKAELRPEVERLAALIDRDLSAWM